jgi:hypothetical protein
MPSGPLQPGSVPFDNRHGITAPFARGIKRQDPGNIPSSQFYNLQNVRVVGNQLISRGGLTKTNSSGALTGTILGIFDDGNGNV